MFGVALYITPGELIKTGTIVSELHYGLEVMIQLHKNPFIIHVVHSIHSPLQPGYICEESEQSSGIVTSASTAITSVYQSIFSTKTKFLGLAYLGLDQNKTAQKLLENITFWPFIIKLESISIFVNSLGKITHSNKVGNHYTASLFYKYKTKQSVFLQCINDNSYSIMIYQDRQVVNEYRDTSPNAVWQQTEVLKSVYVADWDNEIIMNHLFELHLKKAVSKSNEGWHQVFQSWKQQKTWHAVFHAAGCTEITPYDKKNSE
ncbi:8010_t:CDS:2, partial [Cetraspora pellucida]